VLLPQNTSPGGTAVGDALLAVVDSTALVTTNTFGSLWDTWTIPFDGFGFLPSPHQRRLALTPVTADHRHFVVTYLVDAGVLARTFLVPVDATI